MNLLVAAIRVAGAIQVLDIALNLALPRRIRCRENLARLSPLVRQIFLVHWFYILLVLGIFGVACLSFSPELAGGSGLGRFLGGVLAVFWLLRAGIQVFYFDPISASKIGWAICSLRSRRCTWVSCSPSPR